LLVASRELVVGLPTAAREMRRWRARAHAIVEPPLREDALNVLHRKRTHVDGSAMFSTLLPRHEPRLLRLLVAYQLLVDYLDYASERGQLAERDLSIGERNGRTLHTGLRDALDAQSEMVKHYAWHPWSDDVGYLRALVIACRERTSSLPSHRLALPLAREESERAAEVLAINHIPDERRRDRELKAWVARRFPYEERLSWVEIAAAVSGALAIHALLTQAADPHTSSESIRRVHDVYLRRVALATAMLDSHADRLEDAASGGHSYVAHYGARESVEVCRILKETMPAVRELPHGSRHAILVGCMIAMYLSKDDARSPQLAAQTRALLDAGGPMVRRLLPALRAWRIFFSHKSA
jgi:tetraprenyl-beta-curcumene synthase